MSLPMNPRGGPACSGGPHLLGGTGGLVPVFWLLIGRARVSRDLSFDTDKIGVVDLELHGSPVLWCLRVLTEKEKKLEEAS